MRRARHIALRRRLAGTPDRPRLAVFRSARRIYAQIIDDERRITLASASSVDRDLRTGLTGPKISRAAAVGEALAKRALERDVKKVVLDRGGHQYHGRVAALADAAREAGLDF